MNPDNIADELFNKTDKTYLLWTKFALNGPTEIRDYLKSNPSNNSYRDIFINSVLDEVIKVGTVMIRWLTFDGGLSSEKRTEYPGLQVLLALKDEQSLWERKILEILVDLILFSKTNRENYYKHYKLLHNYYDLNSSFQDYQEFFQIENTYVKEMAKASKEELLSHEKFISRNIKNCWYLNNKVVINETDRSKPLFSSFRSRFKLALKSCSKFEKIILGFTYSKYAQSSKGVHFTLNQRMVVEKNAVEENLMNISYSIISVLIRIQDIINKVPGPVNDKIRSYLNGQKVINDHQLKYLFNDIFDLGDFVCTTSGQLGQITKVITSKYGYKICTIRLILENPNSSHDVETLPGFELRKLIKAKDLLKQDEGTGLINLETISSGSFDNILINLWNQGLMEVMSGRLSFKNFIESRARELKGNS